MHVAFPLGPRIWGLVGHFVVAVKVSGLGVKSIIFIRRCFWIHGYTVFCLVSVLISWFKLLGSVSGCVADWK